MLAVLAAAEAAAAPAVVDVASCRVAACAYTGGGSYPPMVAVRITLSPTNVAVFPADLALSPPNVAVLTTLSRVDRAEGTVIDGRARLVGCMTGVGNGARAVSLLRMH